MSDSTSLTPAELATADAALSAAAPLPAPRILADLSAPVAALVLLMAGHRDLPAATIHLSDTAPGQLTVRFHSGGERDAASAFAAWATALGINSDAVTDEPSGDGRLVYREATIDYGGATIELTAYVPAGGAR